MIDIINKIISLKKNGKKVVFTNGCFDIIHAGHVMYLNKAKELGDILVIGLNSDSSIKKIKGDKRPIVNEQDRKFLLENLKSVDYVLLFDEETPYNLIKKIIPDILIKGGDWSIDKIVGGDVVLSNGGKVLNVELLEGRSTTNIIEKVLEVYKNV